jgi:hypothetical protein
MTRCDVCTKFISKRYFCSTCEKKMCRACVVWGRGDAYCSGCAGDNFPLRISDSVGLGT